MGGGNMGGSRSHSSSYQGFLMLGKQGRTLRSDMLGGLDAAYKRSGMDAFALPGYGGPIIAPYSFEQNAGLRSLVGAANPSDLSEVRSSSRAALANQFSTLLAPDLRAGVAAEGGGRYSSAVADTEARYLGQANLDLESKLAELGFQAQESAKNRQMAMFSDLSSYLRILDPTQAQQQDVMTANYDEYKRRWEGGGLFPTIYSGLMPTNSLAHGMSSSQGMGISVGSGGGGAQKG